MGIFYVLAAFLVACGLCVLRGVAQPQNTGRDGVAWRRIFTEAERVKHFVNGDRLCERCAGAPEALELATADEDFLEDGTRTLMAVDVKTIGDFHDATPRAVFSLPPSYQELYNTPDGQRFLFAKSIRENDTDALTVVQNWPALLSK